MVCVVNIMPIPNYLKVIAYNEQQKGDFTSFYLKCKCGCTHFHIYESYLDKNEKELCKPYFDALERSITGGYFSKCTQDENGVIHHWIYLTHSINGPKEEVIIPPKPICACIKVIKVKCSECGDEHIVYDSRFCGYNGVFNENLAEKEYNPHFKLKKRRDNMPVEICISVEHTESFEEFSKNVPCEYSDYTNAFLWIVIYSIDDNNKKRKLFEFETD